MTPLNENEKRGIVEVYKVLVNAIRKDAASATTRPPSRLFSGRIWGSLGPTWTCSPGRISAPTGLNSWTSTCTIRSNPFSGEVQLMTHYRPAPREDTMPSLARMMPDATGRTATPALYARLRVFA